MKPKGIRAASGVLILFLALSLGSRLIPALDLDKLTEEASLIAVGEITLLQEEGTTTLLLEDHSVPARAMVAELRVDQVLKGSGNTSSSFLRFHFAVPKDSSGWVRVRPLDYRIFFLKESSDGLTLVSPYYPSLPAVPGREPPEGIPIERVVDQLEAVLVSATTPLEQKQEAVFALSRTKAVAGTRALRKNAEQKDFTLRLSIAGALLERNDISALPFAEAILLDQHPSAPPYLLHNLTYGISEGVKNEEAVPSLIRLLHAPSTETRRAAASALMHISSNSAIAPLMAALSDSDLQVRYYSAVGLAEITGQMDWRPNMDDFISDQQRYLNHWREWGRNR